MEDNNKKELKDIRYNGVDCIYILQDRDKCESVLNMALKFEC
jgi:hypothetical protein